MIFWDENDHDSDTESDDLNDTPNELRIAGIWRNPDDDICGHLINNNYDKLSDSEFLKQLRLKATSWQLEDQGQTLLHTLVQALDVTQHGTKYQALLSAITNEIVSNPGSVARVNQYGELPLHIAVSQIRLCVRFISELCASYPDGAAARDSRGHLPIHRLLETNFSTMSLDHMLVMSKLLHCYPDAAAARTSKGLLPLHMYCTWYRNNSAGRSIPYLSALIKANPRATQALSSRRELPIAIAIKQLPASADLVHHLWSFASDDIKMRMSISLQFCGCLFITPDRPKGHRPFTKELLHLFCMSLPYSPILFSLELSFSAGLQVDYGMRLQDRLAYEILCAREKTPAENPYVEQLDGVDFCDPAGDLASVRAVDGIEEAIKIGHVYCSPHVIVVFDCETRKQVWIKDIRKSGPRVVDSRRIVFKYRDLDPASAAGVGIGKGSEPVARLESSSIAVSRLTESEKPVLRKLRWKARRDAFLLAARYKGGNHFIVLSEIAHFL